MSRRNKKTPIVDSPRKRCAIYTRKSTSAGLEQEFNSLDAQREACEHYIAAQAHLGWRQLPTRYDDGGFTGANLERPGFRRLMDDMAAGVIDVVVVYKVDRLSRSLLDFAQVMERFNQAGVAFVSVTQNFSTADAMGRLTLNMLMSFAEFEREMIAERTRDKIAAARRRGKWTGGTVPIGYDVVDRRLVINELEAVVVRELFDLYEQHGSALTVAKLLNQRGRTTKRRHTTNGRVHEGRPWCKDSVLRVLRNPVLAGMMPIGDELHDGEHEAVIAPERYARVRALLDARTSKRKRTGRNPAYLLGGLLRCKLCGGALTPASTRKGKREYRYYRCVTRDKFGSKSCEARPLPAGEIERYVAEQIREATSDGQLVDEIATQLEQRIASERQALITEQRELPRAIDKLSRDEQELVKRGGEQAERRGEEIRAEIERHRARLTEVEQQLGRLEQAKIEAEWVTTALSHFDAVWDAMTLENRRRLVCAVVEEVAIDEPTGEVAVKLAHLGLPEQKSDDRVLVEA